MPARENDLEIKIVKKWQSQSTSTWKFAPRLRERTIWKSKSLKTERFGALLEVQGLGPLFQVENAFHVAGAGISTRHPHKNR